MGLCNLRGFRHLIVEPAEMTEQMRSGDWPLLDSALRQLARALPGLPEQGTRALGSLQRVHRFFDRDAVIVARGEEANGLRLVSRGWAARSVGIDADRRQILDFVLPGDLAGLHVDRRGRSTCEVVALTGCEVIEFDLAEVARLAGAHPEIGRALRSVLERELALLGDQVLRLGRMTAYERVGHFLLGLYLRQGGPDRPDGTVDFPVTQTLVSDALGLSVVHVNRQVMQFRREGVLTLDRRTLTVRDERALRRIAGLAAAF